MTTTPTIWKSKFNPNFAGLAGEQYQPHSIGLTNGNILVIWGDNSFGPSPGADLVGQIFNPLGNPVGTQFQVNENATENAEFKGRLAALPDGGFIMVYQSDNLIIVERFDASGESLVANIIGGAYLGPNDPYFDVTVQDNGDYVVAYSKFASSGNLNVRALVFDYNTNSRGAEHVNTAQNSGDSDFLGDIATFANGNIISTSFELDSDPLFGSFNTVEVRITTPTGAPVLSFVELAGSDNNSAISDDIVVLTNGKFVGLYHYDEGPNTISARIGTVGATSIQLGSEIDIGPANGINTQRPSLVALQDGGFFVAWINSNTVFGTRYASNGDVIGTKGFVVATGASGDLAALGQLSLTSDGRILVPFRDSNREIAEVILDPRDNTVQGTDQSEVLTGQIGESLVLGYGGNDRIYGLNEVDYLYGGSGVDTVTGGKGGDYVFGGADNDFLFGDQGNDVLYGEGDQDYLDGSSGNDSLYGGAAFDRLSGGADNDILDGGENGDLMQGFSGNDTYYIDSSADIVDELIAGSNGSDIVRSSNLSINLAYSSVFKGNIESAVLGGGGNLNLTGNALGNYLQGNSGANIINGGGGSDTLVGLGGADTFRFANSLGPSNIDKITDYNQAQDTIQLDNAYFTALPTGFLFASAFAANTTGLATDASDRIIYETDTGKLFYDSNGTAAGGTYQQFAQLSAGLSMSAGEFFVV